MAVSQEPQLLSLFFMIVFSKPVSTCVLDVLLFSMSVLKWGLQLDLTNVPQVWLPPRLEAVWVIRQPINGGERVKMYGFLKSQFCALDVKIVFKYIVHLLLFNQCLLLICFQPSGLQLIRENWWGHLETWATWVSVWFLMHVLIDANYVVYLIIYGFCLLLEDKPNLKWVVFTGFELGSPFYRAFSVQGLVVESADWKMLLQVKFGLFAKGLEVATHFWESNLMILRGVAVVDRCPHEAVRTVSFAHLKKQLPNNTWWH